MPTKAKKARRAARDTAATENFFSQAPSVQPDKTPAPLQSQSSLSETAATSSVSQNPDTNKDFPAQKSTCRIPPTAEQIVIRAVSRRFKTSFHHGL